MADSSLPSQLNALALNLSYTHPIRLAQNRFILHSAYIQKPYISLLMLFIDVSHRIVYIKHYQLVGKPRHLLCSTACKVGNLLLDLARYR